MNYNTDTTLNEETGLATFAIFTVLIILFIFIAFFINSYLLFKNERDYIKLEMERSFEEEEYLYWKRALKMLYIRKIPIIRSFARIKHK